MVRNPSHFCLASCCEHCNFYHKPAFMDYTYISLFSYSSFSRLFSLRSNKQKEFEEEKNNNRLSILFFRCLCISPIIVSRLVSFATVSTNFASKILREEACNYIVSVSTTIYNETETMSRFI